jgi:hypothetical protein
METCYATEKMYSLLEVIVKHQWHILLRTAVMGNNKLQEAIIDN